MPRVVRHILLFISVGLMLAPVAMAQQPTVLRGTIDYVVDGDTVRIVSRGFQTTIRLIGIDTPETKRPGYPVQCGGPAASAETTRLLPVGLAVRVVSDPSQDIRRSIAPRC
jgi:micrococcal nuclease